MAVPAGTTGGVWRFKRLDVENRREAVEASVLCGTLIHAPHLGALGVEL